MKIQAELYRELPSVDELVHSPALAELINQEGPAAVVDACRAVVSRLRQEIGAGHLSAHDLQLALADVHVAIRQELSRALRHSLQPVINATGVILHTNLGRAPIAQSAFEHIRETAGSYSNLEFDLAAGERGRRDVHVDRLFRKLLEAGSPSAPVSTIVVNNNAAAVLLALNTLAEGGEVIVSRGELVEIGGSFRIPDVMSKSGARLREVGTTNRTRISDYEQALSERTRLLLRVHRSNFKISGFTEQPTVRELAGLARKHRVPLLEDLGSGALFDLAQVGIKNEPGVLDSLRAGVDVVTYSGDKLLGGPQAGLLSGREDLVQKMRSNSLFRALRVDKLTYAALESTLVAYLKRDYDAVPALRMMQTSKSEIARRAAALMTEIAAASERAHPLRLAAELIDSASLLGGGSAPSATIPTTVIALTCYSLSANELAARLRAGVPPVIARVEEGKVLLDLRTVFPEQDKVLTQVLVNTATV
ncbi:MAG TPA: L-seryl-tRNA(Sec) selenium transferase [Terriglobales bacterium]|jgi:L-seryl-tRNA(Ser) seleniumtransferase|nr:L-seryl-tRNA(Sec) selenium transferase [Terriglobales bacterium]